MDTAADHEWEDRLLAMCQQAGVTGTEAEIVLYHLLDDLSARQIRKKLRLKRVSETQATLHANLRKLTALPDFWEAAREFPRHLLFCLENGTVYDDREPGVRGVTPADAGTRCQGAAMISADHPSLRQDLPSAARLWAQSLQPRHAVSVPA